MIKQVDQLKIGTVLNNKEITEIFHCQFEGGIRKSKKLNLPVLINDPKYGLYDNRWEGDTLYFTAIGRRGDQSLDSPWQNKDLNHSKENQQKLYLFDKQTPSHYEYKGEVEIIDDPFKEQQKEQAKGDVNAFYLSFLPDKEE